LVQQLALLLGLVRVRNAHTVSAAAIDSNSEKTTNGRASTSRHAPQEICVAAGLLDLYSDGMRTNGFTWSFNGNGDADDTFEIKLSTGGVLH